MATSSSLKQRDRGGAFAKRRLPVRWSLAGLGLVALAIIFVGWVLIGWPVLVAAAVAVMVARFA